MTDNEISADVLIELKSTEQMHPVFMKQVKTYLVIMKLHLDLVVNFGLATLKEGFVRVINGY